MDTKKIINKYLNEHHDLIRSNDCVVQLELATNSLVKAIRHLESAIQIIENKECNEVIDRLLNILRHPMGNTGYGGFDYDSSPNILAMIESVSSIVNREKKNTIKKRNEFDLDNEI